MGKTLKQLREELLANPGVREAYEEQAPEFAIARAIIAVRDGAGLGQAETTTPRDTFSCGAEPGVRKMLDCKT